MKETEWTLKTPATEAIQTVYVHLCSGDVQKIAEVTEIAVTDTDVIFTRGQGEAAIFPRRSIYFCSDEPDAEPPAY